MGSGDQSQGHRFHAPGYITFLNASDYVACLANEGKVVASFDERKRIIREQIEQSAANLGGVAHIEEALLNEVTGLVEFPVAVCGTFDAEFLSIPVEALVMTMQDNQKYFALFDQQGALLPNFITISNIDSKQPEMVAKGNERVIRPRFADARFFFEQDQKQPLSQRSELLDKVVFQNKLGSVGDKSRRIAKLAVSIAKQIGADEAQVERAAQLCKCDLMTEMVGEFPKLQGLMGRYYAEFDHEPKAVSDAVEQHYWPKFSGDQLPSNDVAQCVALADRLDSLVGIFGIGQKPRLRRCGWGRRQRGGRCLREEAGFRGSRGLAEAVSLPAHERLRVWWRPRHQKLRQGHILGTKAVGTRELLLQATLFRDIGGEIARQVEWIAYNETLLGIQGRKAGVARPSDRDAL